jgi:HK97 family phage portal protein
MSPVLIDSDGELVELGGEQDRGNLRRSSTALSAWDGSPFWGGKPVSYAKLFATQPWVAIAVMRLLTWAIRVPLKVYRLGDADGDRHRVRYGEHPLATAVVSPWSRASMADLIMAMLGPLCVHGNDLLDVDSGAGDAIRFKPLDWRYVSPIRDDEANPNDEILGWKYYGLGEADTLSAETVMHLRWWSPLGQLGVSPLQQLGATIALERAAVEWQLNTLDQSVRPSGVVQVSDEALKLPRSERQLVYEDAVENLRKNYGGRHNAGKLPVMPPGMAWETASTTTAVEAELINQRAVNRNETASIYMLPPPVLGILERATFNNIVELRQMAYTDGLAPPLILAEHTLNAHVVKGLLREEDLFLEFDFAAVLRGDRLKEIKALREAIGMGLMTPNEGRDVINLKRSDSKRADELWMPKNNLAPIDEPSPAEKKQAAAGGGASQ